MSFNAIRENKILAKISESAVTAYADESSKAMGLNLDRDLHLHPYFVYVSSESLLLTKLNEPRMRFPTI